MHFVEHGLRRSGMAYFAGEYRDGTGRWHMEALLSSCH